MSVLGRGTCFRGMPREIARLEGMYDENRCLFLDRRFDVFVRFVERYFEEKEPKLDYVRISCRTYNIVCANCICQRVEIKGKITALIELFTLDYKFLPKERVDSITLHCHIST